MKLRFLPSREISAKPGEVMRRLHEEGPLVITDHGQPRALMLPVTDETLLDTAVDVLAHQALTAIRARGRTVNRAGLRKMVKQVRKARRARAA